MEIQGVRVLQQAMETGETTAASIVRECIQRIEKTDPGAQGLGAVLEMNPEALEIAGELDRERALGKLRGPLHGIPVLLKANIDTADRMATTAGSLALKDHIAPKDAFHVDLLRTAGAIVLGKTNLSEWANFRGERSVSGWSSLGGQTRNPYALDRTPCGSSSGSAAAVAAGYTPLAIGTETDGSIVCPAQTCGVVGIKPTLGTVSRSGIIPIAHSQDTAGPMANCVEDAALLLTAIAGTDPNDAATRDYAQHVLPPISSLIANATLDGVRVGVMRNAFGKHPKVDRLMEVCLETLSLAGAELVDPASIETAGKWSESEFEVLLYEFKHDLGAYLSGVGPKAAVHSIEELIAFNREHADQVMPHFGQELLEKAAAKGPLSEQAYIDALARNHRLTRDEGIDATLENHKVDVLVAPTGAPAWYIDTVLGDLGLGGCSSVAAVSGYPHITVPAGTIDGLPVGLSFLGSAWSDGQLIQYAHAFEQVHHSKASNTR